MMVHLRRICKSRLRIISRETTRQSSVREFVYNFWLLTEQALRAAFNELSRNEQVKALTDMYAFPGSASLEENPAMVNRLLRDFEEEVQRE